MEARNLVEEDEAEYQDYLDDLHDTESEDDERFSEVTNYLKRKRMRDPLSLKDMSDKDLYSRALDLQSILEGELSEEDRAKYEKEDYDLVSEIVRRRRTKDGKVSDSLDDMIAELEAIPWWATDEVTKQVKKIVAQNGTKTIKKDGKEILTFAESQSGTPLYSYKQHAWTPFDKVQDDGVTHMSDIGSNRPGKLCSDSSELSKFKVKLRDVEEVRKRFKDAGIPLYWSGRFLYADAPETKVDEILGDIDHTFFLTLSGGDGMMWIKIPDDKQRHDAMVKLIVAGLQTHAAGDRLLVREDRDKVKEVLEGFDYQIMDSSQADQMSFSWEEFADKVDSADDATSYSDHVVVSGDKAYRVSITAEESAPVTDSIWGTAKEATRFSSRAAARRVMVYNKLQDSAKVVKSTKGFFKIVDASGKSYKGSKVCDCWIFSKQELLEKRPSWVADSAIWEKAVDRLTGDFREYANAKSVVMLYKRLGGTHKVKDSFIRGIQVGDTLRIVRGDHVGEFGEVLAVNPDGTFTLKNLVTGEEFTEPETLFGLKVNVEDSENGPKIEDVMDAPSLKRALSVILETADPQNRKRSVTSKVATFLNYYNLDVEVEPEDNTIWLSDDDTKLKVDEDKIWIMRPGEKPESFGLLDDIESWFARVKELSPVNPQA